MKLNNSGSESLEEGEVNSDSGTDSRELSRDPPLQKSNSQSLKHGNPFLELKATLQNSSNLTLYKCEFQVKHIHEKKLIQQVIRHSEVADTSVK